MEQTLPPPLKKERHDFRAFVAAGVAVIGMNLSLNLYDPEKGIGVLFSENNFFTRILTDLYLSMSNNRLLLFIEYVGMVFLFIAAGRVLRTLRVRAASAVLSAFFSLCQIFGISFAKTNSLDLIFLTGKSFFKASLCFVGYFTALYAGFLLLLNGVAKVEASLLEEKNECFSMHCFMKIWALFFAVWLPLFLVFFPGLSNRDTRMQILQFFHQPTVMGGVPLTELSSAGENCYITNHHPFFLTVLFGLFAKFGVFLGNVDYGIAMYILMQMLFFSGVFSGVFSYLKCIKVHRKIRMLCMVLYLFWMPYGLWSIHMLKDPIFSVCCLLWVVFLVEIVRTKGSALCSWRFCAALFAAMLLVCLTKNQGIYLVFLTGIAFAVAYRKYWKQVIPVFLCVVIFYQGIYIGCILPALHVAPGGVQEALSIPFQQTARYVKEWDKEVTEEERKAINAVLPYGELAELYNPTLSDPVKIKYNQKATNQDLLQYFKVWLKQFFKHPGTYVEATLNNTYGYFYANKASSWSYKQFYYPDEAYMEYVLEKYRSYYQNAAGWSITDDLYCAETIANLQGGDYPGNRGILEFVFSTLAFAQRIPFTGLLFGVGTMAPLVFICSGIFVFLRKKRYLLGFLPAILSVFVLLASPESGNWRYVLPLVYILPFMVTMLFYKEPVSEHKRKEETVNG